MDGAIDGGQQQVLADGETLVAFGRMGVEDFDEPIESAWS